MDDCKVQYMKVGYNRIYNRFYAWGVLGLMMLHMGAVHIHAESVHANLSMKRLYSSGWDDGTRDMVNGAFKDYSVVFPAEVRSDTVWAGLCKWVGLAARERGSRALLYGYTLLSGVNTNHLTVPPTMRRIKAALIYPEKMEDPQPVRPKIRSYVSPPFPFPRSRRGDELYRRGLKFLLERYNPYESPVHPDNRQTLEDTIALLVNNVSESEPSLPKREQVHHLIALLYYNLADYEKAAEYAAKTLRDFIYDELLRRPDHDVMKAEELDPVEVALTPAFWMKEDRRYTVPLILWSLSRMILPEPRVDLAVRGLYVAISMEPNERLVPYILSIFTEQAFQRREITSPQHVEFLADAVLFHCHCTRARVKIPALQVLLIRCMTMLHDRQNEIVERAGREKTDIAQRKATKRALTDAYIRL